MLDVRDEDRCQAKIHKRVSSVTLSIKAHERAMQQLFMGTEEFLQAFQNPQWSRNITLHMLRKLYRADRMPVRGSDTREILLWL